MRVPLLLPLLLCLLEGAYAATELSVPHMKEAPAVTPEPPEMAKPEGGIATAGPLVLAVPEEAAVTPEPTEQDVLEETASTIDPPATYRVLMLLPVSSRSHRNVFMPLATALTERGHQVRLDESMGFYSCPLFIFFLSNFYSTQTIMQEPYCFLKFIRNLRTLKSVSNIHGS